MRRNEWKIDLFETRRDYAIRARVFPGRHGEGDPGRAAESSANRAADGHFSPDAQCVVYESDETDARMSSCRHFQ